MDSKRRKFITKITGKLHHQLITLCFILFLNISRSTNLSIQYRLFRTKERKLAKNGVSKKYLNKSSKKRKKAFRIRNIEEVINELNSLTNIPIYVDLLFKTLRERNKSLLRTVVDELGMGECTRLLREVAMIQESGGMKVENENRYKTLGGVFFYLIRKNTSLSKQTKDRIFKPEKRYLKAKKTIVDDLEKLLTLGNE